MACGVHSEPPWGHIRRFRRHGAIFLERVLPITRALMKGWFSWQYLFNSHLCMPELVSLAAACAMNSLLYQVGEGHPFSWMAEGAEPCHIERLPSSNGARGALFLPRSEFAKNLSTWTLWWTCTVARGAHRKLKRAEQQAR